MSNSISISITDSGDHTGITRAISALDPLVSIIEAFLAAVKAEGLAEDSRFQELAEHWQHLVASSIDYDDRNDDDDYESPVTQDFQVDDIVVVAHVVDDSDCVLGKTGRIVKMDEDDWVTVTFPGWMDGWSWKGVDEADCCWNVRASALELRYRLSF